MNLTILNHTRLRVREAWIKRWIAELTRALLRRGYKEVKDKDLILVFATQPEIRRLNRDYRGKDYATDILSFAPLEPDSLGELVVSMAVLKRQAKRTGLSEQGELGYMLVHGVLHLLGFDHETPKEREEMFGLQDAIFKGLNSRKPGVRA